MTPPLPRCSWESVGVTNADERIWLVFWEAGVILQIPAGVFVVYPSALLLHFNVDINGKQLPRPLDNSVLNI